jgi:hypothetical protein
MVQTARFLPHCYWGPPGAGFAKRKVAMENCRIDGLRVELDQLLKKQAEILESRTLGAASDTELLEYEIRQEIIHEICNQLANSTAA